AKAVLVKGGHLAKDHPAVDLFFDGETFEELVSERIETKNTHGTGCTFSAAVCAFLAKGMSLTVSLESSKAFVTEAIRNSLEIGKGHGPLTHFGKT
ncbi:MAG: bifunctional hydroxymethylpyrimidine kinase/phosphomethylpyrimidine kinase, partial [bacterium]|nr:bifunctional hydroxymethylpyrimidine kinase/phosphomethylpyrimidine kinase [bacterium]